MSKKSEKATAAEPLRAKSVLSGPSFRLGPGLPRCSLKIPGEILQAAGLGPNCPVELTATDDSIVIKRAGDPRPLPNPSPRNDAMNALMKLSVEQRTVDPRKEMEESSDDGKRRDLFVRVEP